MRQVRNSGKEASKSRVIGPIVWSCCEQSRLVTEQLDLANLFQIGDAKARDLLRGWLAAPSKYCAYRAPSYL